MKSKKKIYITAFLTLCAIGAFVYVYVHAASTNAVLPLPAETEPSQSVSVAANASVATTPSPASPTVSAVVPSTLSAPSPNNPLPVTLNIPSLKITAPIIEVGITATGAMDTPHVYGKVGWYEYGTLPGDVGSAVIAGHVNDDFGFPGIFRNLKNIQKGADVEVTLSNGEMLHFTVIDISAYDYQNAPVQQIFGQDDGRYVKLITCTGIDIPSQHTFNQRLVVTAELENS